MKFRDADLLRQAHEMDVRRNELKKLLRQVQELPRHDRTRLFFEPMIMRCIEHEANGEYDKCENLLAVTVRAVEIIREKEAN